MKSANAFTKWTVELAGDLIETPTYDGPARRFLYADGAEGADWFEYEWPFGKHPYAGDQAGEAVNWTIGEGYNLTYQMGRRC